MNPIRFDGRLSRYALAYALVVSLCTALLERFPAFLQIEFAVYDPLQRLFVIDDNRDLRYHIFQPYLNELYAVNLDERFFDPKTDQLRRDSLANLLDRLTEAPGIQAVFLDFLYLPVPGSGAQAQRSDSVLAQHMNQLAGKLVMPYEVQFDPIPVFGPLTAGVAKVRQQLIYEPPHAGYLAPMMLVGDDTYRYHKLRLEDGSHHSAVYALLEAIPAKDAIAYTRHIPNTFEINYLLRNDSTDFVDALPVVDASILQTLPDSTLQQELNGKIVMIALFRSMLNKYDTEVDAFETPVSGSLNGIYVFLNAYLNVVANAYFHRASLLLVFLVNFFLGLGAAIYYLWMQQQYLLKPAWVIVAEIAASVVLFGALLLTLYLGWHIKFPFVLSTLAFVRNHSLVHFYDRKIEPYWRKISKPI